MERTEGPAEWVHVPSVPNNALDHWEVDVRVDQRERLVYIYDSDTGAHLATASLDSVVIRWESPSQPELVDDEDGDRPLYP